MRVGSPGTDIQSQAWVGSKDVHSSWFQKKGKPSLGNPMDYVDPEEREEPSKGPQICVGFMGKMGGAPRTKENSLLTGLKSGVTDIL